MKDRLLGSPFPEERVGRAAVEETFGSWGKRGCTIPVADSSKVLLLAISFLSLSRCRTREWGARKRAWGSLLLQRQSQEQMQPALSLPGLWLCQPCPFTRPIIRGHRSRSGVPKTPTRCCLDMISQTSTDSMAGLAGSTTDKWQVCMGGAKGGGAPTSSGTFTDRCCSLSYCCWAQTPASLLPALSTFQLESQQDFYFPVGHFPAASVPASLAGAGCVPLPQVRGPTPGPGSGCSPPAWRLRADAKRCPLLLFWRPPAAPSVLLPLRQPPRHPTARQADAGCPLVTEHGRPHGWEVMGRGC